MVNGNHKVAVLANSNHDHPHAVVRARLPKIAKSSRATGVWSRKISPAGVSYLKMDDEVKKCFLRIQGKFLFEKIHLARIIMNQCMCSSVDCKKALTNASEYNFAKILRIFHFII